MNVRTFFDAAAPTWDDNEIMSTPERVADLLRRVDIRPGERVLDLGTGTGVLLPHICKLVGASGAVTAVDFSPEMLARAEAKYGGCATPRIEFVCKDFEEEAIADTFDHVLLYCVYPHLRTPIDTLTRLWRENLAAGGRITIAFPADEGFVNVIHSKVGSCSTLLPSAKSLALRLRRHNLPAEVVSDANPYVVTIGNIPISCGK
jgi:demethylmenaquinone methyltransferase/2-methoxy-6-polyprenyl-1,4-benzoquinol methylase